MRAASSFHASIAFAREECGRRVESPQAGLALVGARHGGVCAGGKQSKAREADDRRDEEVAMTPVLSSSLPASRR
jgi:hypothetical protein